MKPLHKLNYCHSYAKLGPALSSFVDPTPITTPYLIHANSDLATRLGIDLGDKEELAQLLSGKRTLPQWKPLAMKYTGHQFGQYNPDLGDGRGLLLAEFIDDSEQKWDMHLKGSGQTPFSRMGDGRAVIRSSVREYLISAAMTGLGIETTQALALVGSQTPVRREELERAATLLRIAPTHIRFGHFEYLFYSGQQHLIQPLMDHVINWHFPKLKGRKDRFKLFLSEVVKRTAKMIAGWQAYGFYHGVMNTDNMSILGQTFDYGPYAFIEQYQPNFVGNHTDYEGRYAFNRQPGIAHWNLSALGYALSSVLEKDDIEVVLASYVDEVQAQYTGLMRERFGLISSKEGDSDELNHVLVLMEKLKLDYNHSFRRLSELTYREWFSEPSFQDPEWQLWMKQYQHRLELDYSDEAERIKAMCSINPKYILRTHLTQEVIDEMESGRFDIVDSWMKVLANPFVSHQVPSHWSKPARDGGVNICLSCSS